MFRIVNTYDIFWFLYQEFWIGRNDKEQEGTFVTVDGRTVGYSNWIPNRPNNVNNQDCAAMEKIPGDNGKWNDRACDRVFAYICEFRCF